MENKKQNKEFWDEFSKVFNLDINVTVQKTVSKDDIIISLLNEGDFISKFSNGHSKMNLEHMKGKCSKEKISVFREILWEPIEKYLAIKRETTQSQEKTNNG